MSGPVLQLRDATVELPGGHQILSGVDWALRAGEIHSLMGENGAGKSTLIRAINGTQRLARGEVLLDGESVSFRSTQESRAAGISTVFQETQLLQHLSVAENVMLGNESRGRFGIGWRATRRRAREILAMLGLDDLDERELLSALPPAAQQIVAIARAMVGAPRVVLLDEPTAGLQQADVDRLFSVLRRMRAAGVGIVFVSHFLEQVFQLSDRITVLRDGATVGTVAPNELDRVELISMMLGSDLRALQELASERAEHSEMHEGPALLRATGIGRADTVLPTDIALHGGEIVGLAGLRGSGRTELAKLLSGVERPDCGELILEDRVVRADGPRAGMLHGLVLSPEWRHRGGLVHGLSVEENILLSLQALRGWRHPVPLREREVLVAWAMRAFGLEPETLTRPVDELSGGQQQKVMLARLFVVKPKVLLLDEPTRGCDIASKVDIQRLIATLADQGVAVLLISSELPELIRLADRIVVQKDRAKIGELNNGPGVSVDTLVELIASNDEVSPPVERELGT